MSGKRLYRHLRESGIVVTLDKAVELRAIWLKTFPEMKKHMERTPIKEDPYAKYGLRKDTEEEEEEQDNKRDLYKTTTITGFVRNRATYNAACNTDFQNPVAVLAKEAMWNVEQAGLGSRLTNFVHDEIIYYLYPNEIKTTIPIIEKLWLEPAQRYFPHVKLKCESEVGIRWDKGNTEFEALKWDANGYPILEDTKYVKENIK